MAPPRPIVLTTDFGLADSYVGVMKGVILTINPAALIVDLTHQVQPQNLAQAAFVLKTGYALFPPGSIHVAVVDPGVGTARKAVLLTCPSGAFVAPDNGILSGVLGRYVPAQPAGMDTVPVPAQCAAYELVNPHYQLQPVSNTFHGRDIFAPAAAHLSLGVPPSGFGPPVSELVWLPTPEPVQTGGRITGQVIYADHFGNLVTNIPQELLPDASWISVAFKSHRMDGLHRTFHDNPEHPPGTPLALIGSNGYLEIAVPNGSAAALLNAGPGEPIVIHTR